MVAQSEEGILSPFLAKKRMSKVLPFLNGSVLDYGCGVGNLAEVVDKDYVGFDIDNETFSKKMIAAAFKISKKAVIVDMLSLMIDSSYAKEDFVFYHNPLKMLDFSLSLTPHVQLRHDYGSIPQREFLLILRKEPWI